MDLSCNNRRLNPNDKVIQELLGYRGGFAGSSSGTLFP